MSFDKDQIELAMSEIGSAILRLQRAGLTEGQARLVINRVTEMDELPVSCDEKMWNHAEPKGDESADAVKEGSDDAPETRRDAVPWHKQVKVDKDDDDDKSADTVRDPVQKEGAEKTDETEDCAEAAATDGTVAEEGEIAEGWDRFMDVILVTEGKKELVKDLPDSPGMQIAKRYSEKAHNRIVYNKK